MAVKVDVRTVIATAIVVMLFTAVVRMVAPKVPGLSVLAPYV